MSLIRDVMGGTATIRRPGPPVRDSTGSLVPGPPVTIPVTGCAVISPYGVTVGSSSETHNASNTVVTRRVFAAPLGTDIRFDDKIIYEGRTYQVRGRPLEFRFTSLARVEADVEEVTG